ncbi:MAG TPA: twin transmembrane helix small protein [Moraxellaceae bacterium]|nr:twin transmembrane helix small protein [Moraxellaceae bacterium]
MWIKIIVLAVMAAVLVNLFIALKHLTRGGEGASKKSLHSLTWRLGLSIALFILLYVASYFGLISPHGVSPVAPAPSATSAPR